MAVTAGQVAQAANRAAHARIHRTAVERHADGEAVEPYAPEIAGNEEYYALTKRASLPLIRVHVSTLARDARPTGYIAGDDAEPSEELWRTRERTGTARAAQHARRLALVDGRSYVVMTPAVSRRPGEPTSWRPTVHQEGAVRAEWSDPLNQEMPDELIVAAAWSGSRPSAMVSYDEEGVTVWSPTSGGRWDPGAVGRTAYDQFGGQMPVGIYTAGEWRKGDHPWLTDQREITWWPSGEVWPLIGAQRRVTQAIFDTLLVQQFGAVAIRTMTGVELPNEDPTSEESRAYTLKLAIDRMLVSEDPEARFGSLPATPMDPFTNGIEAAVRHFALAASLSPTRLMRVENVSAEAIASARQPEEDLRASYRDLWSPVEQRLTRFAAIVAGAGDPGEDGEVVWQETEVRSISQLADAVVKFAQAGVPVQPLLRRSLHWTPSEVAQVVQLMAADAQARQDNFSTVVQSTRERAAEAAALAQARGA